MNQDIQAQLDKLSVDIESLKAISIKVNIEPDTAAILRNLLVPSIASVIANYPTSTYSASSPTGGAVIGSVWYEDTGSLATRKIHVYSGSSWVQFK